MLANRFDMGPFFIFRFEDPHFQPARQITDVRAVRGQSDIRPRPDYGNLVKIKNKISPSFEPFVHARHQSRLFEREIVSVIDPALWSADHGGPKNQSITPRVTDGRDQWQT